MIQNSTYFPSMDALLQQSISGANTRLANLLSSVTQTNVSGLNQLINYRNGNSTMQQNLFGLNLFTDNSSKTTGDQFNFSGLNQAIQNGTQGSVTQWNSFGNLNAKPTAPSTTVAVTENGTVWGDPHFIGGDDDRFDVMGQAGHTYNLLSDSNLNINARFDGNSNVTWVGAVGISAGTDQIQFDAASTPTLNGQTVQTNQNYNLSDGGSMNYNGTSLFLNNANNGEYKSIEFRRTGPGSMDVHVTTGAQGVATDGVNPGGLLGMTFDADNVQRNGQTGAGAQGQGAFDAGKSVATMETNGLFGVSADDRRGSLGTNNLVQNGSDNTATQIISASNPGGPKVAAVESGTVWGDPHFIGGDGDKFDVMGQAGHTYNLLSDSNLQVNARFDGNSSVTYVGAVGVQAGSDKIQFEASGTPTLNGQTVQANKTYSLNDGGSMNYNGTSLFLNNSNNGEYKTIEFRKTSGVSMDVHVSTSDKGVAADGVTPGGLLGMTFDADNVQRNGKTGAGAQGEGAFDAGKSVASMETNGLFGNNFADNRFGQAVTPGNNVVTQNGNRNTTNQINTLGGGNTATQTGTNNTVTQSNTTGTNTATQSNSGNTAVQYTGSGTNTATSTGTFNTVMQGTENGTNKSSQNGIGLTTVQQSTSGTNTTTSAGIANEVKQTSTSGTNTTTVSGIANDVKQTSTTGANKTTDSGQDTSVKQTTASGSNTVQQAGTSGDAVQTSTSGSNTATQTSSGNDVKQTSTTGTNTLVQNGSGNTATQVTSTGTNQATLGSGSNTITQVATASGGDNTVVATGTGTNTVTQASNNGTSTFIGSSGSTNNVTQIGTSSTNFAVLN